MGDTVQIGLLFTASTSAAIGGVRSIGANIDTLKTKGERLNRSFTEIGAAIKKSAAAGKDVNALGKQYERLWSSIERAKTAAIGLQVAQDKAAAHKAGITGMWGQAAGTVGMGLTLAAPVKEAIGFESAMSDVSKVVDGTDTEITQLGKDIVGMTRSIPLAAKDLAAIAAAGGQLGIGLKDLKGNDGFISTVAKMATAFDMPAEQAGDSMAKLKNIYKFGNADMVKVGDAINTLADKGTAKASDMVNALTRLGTNAKDFGLSVQQAAAWGNVIASTSPNVEMGATAMNSLMTALKVIGAGKGTPEAREALAKIGFTAARLKKEIGQDANGALTNFIGTLNKLDEFKKTATIAALMGAGDVDNIAPIIGGMDLLKQSFGYIAESSGSMEREFRKRAATTANNLILLKNNVTELGISVGAVLLPALNNLLGTVRPIVYKTIEWSNAHPKLVANLGKAAGALIGLSAASMVAKAGYHALGYGAWTAIGRIRAVQAAWTATTAAMKAESLGAAVAKLGLVGKAATGVGAAVAGISLPVIVVGALLVGIGLLVYKYWRPLKDFFIGFWRGFKMGIEPLKPLFDTTFAYWAPTFTKIGSGLKPVISWIGNLLQPVESSGEATRKFGETVGFVVGEVVRWLTQTLPSRLALLPGIFKDLGANMIGGLIQGIKGKMDAAKDAIVNVGSSVKGWFASTLGIQSPSRVFMRLGGYLDEGLALGIGGSLSQVKAAAGQLAKSALPNLGNAQGALSSAMTALPKLSDARSMQSTMNHTLNVTNNFPQGVAGSAGALSGAVRGTVEDGFDQFRKQMARYQQEMGRRAFGGAVG